MSTQIFHVCKILLMTIDPVHVGTGGMRLGGVDNTIVREPGTRIPKIPGTSLSGAIRQYAARRFGNKIQCAGQEGHCGRPTCPICYTFGFVKGESLVKAHSGMVSIGDAYILFFPVYSMVGPVWITCPSALKGFGLNAPPEPASDRQGIWDDKLTSQDHINLGWLMVQKENSKDVSLSDLDEVPRLMKERVVVVTDRIFSQLINSNLEVRTSVSINPETGAAQDKALFTYEAIPRAAVMWLEIVEDDFRGEFPSKKRLEEWSNLLQNGFKEEAKKLAQKWGLLQPDDNGKEISKKTNEASMWVEEDKAKYDSISGQWHKNGSTKDDRPVDVVLAGLELVEHLGIGGMGTRGFGRVRLLHPCKPESEVSK